MTQTQKVRPRVIYGQEYVVSKRFLVSLLFVSALSLPAAAGECPPPAETVPMSWSDWLANLVIDFVLGPIPEGPGYTYECTDVEIYFD